MIMTFLRLMAPVKQVLGKRWTGRQCKSEISLRETSLRDNLSETSLEIVMDRNTVQEWGDPW